MAKESDKLTTTTLPKITTFSNWRVIAENSAGEQHLILMGHSYTKITDDYPQVYSELLDEDEKSNIRSISLERWFGTSTKGKWVRKQLLSIP